MSTPNPLSPADQAALENYWLPFTPNRYFKKNPKVVVGAKGAYYQTADGKQLFDALSGLWCTPLGHGNPRIVEAITKQAQTLDYATAFQIAHPGAIRLAGRIADLAPEGLNKVFFANSGSEAADTAIKMAIAYHRIRGEGGRFRIIGRERGYHGVGFGGVSAGGLVANRKMFGTAMLPGVDHLPHTWNPKEMAFTRGQPQWGTHLADELERLVGLHDASTIAAVIVEPMQGSTGVVVPPVGYLQRLRDICTKHGILLIFDEVITGFGRMGTTFGADYFGVTPDLITFAKAITNGTVPMGGVIAKDSIYDTFMGIQAPDYAIEFLHGYTYSGHPMATGVAHAVLDVMHSDGLIQRAGELAPVLEEAIHSLKGEPGVTDIRNIGLAAAVDLEPCPGQPGWRAMQVFEHAMQNGVLLRFSADTIAMGPPFISTPDEIAKMVDVLRAAIRAVPASPKS
ncbi:aspartate aminotransferase family protein [Aquabacterium sp.]|uniref:aspartate aminotransferase family protein n=1 Tax=Aquabacterium sp. TaxID=1872578 RepID=UPI0035AD966B